MNRLLLVIAAIVLLCLGSIAQAVTIDTVAVGNTGNADDTLVMYDGTTGYGSVGYNYNIGKYEVTAGQYTAFLNAVAATDTYGLYNTYMANPSYACGITRSGASGTYTYSVDSDFINRPVNYVSWGDSARFANWLHNGQPTGPQGLATTEDGAYFLNGATTSTQLQAVSREADWRWAVTSEDEWYKAAYYDSTKAGGAGYWDYPTISDTAPGRDLADASGNNANYYISSGTYPIIPGKYSTVCGEFQNSDSPYGTFDQGGNVWEWNEAIIDGASRGIRGGSYNYYALYLQGWYRNSAIVTDESNMTGFRVVQAVPEPSSLLALLGGLAGLLGLRRRRA